MTDREFDRMVQRELWVMVNEYLGRYHPTVTIKAVTAIRNEVWKTLRDLELGVV